MDSYLHDLLDDSQLEALSAVERATRVARAALMEERRELSRSLHGGAELGQLEETRQLREDPEWRVAPPPADLTYRLVELATPATPEAAQSAVASGADVWVADLEDMLVPTDSALRTAHEVIRDVAQTRNGDPQPRVPTLMVRPRGLHLDEAHLEVDGVRVSAPVADIVTFLAVSGPVLIANGTAPYLYLPKVETWQEAAWWDDVIARAEQELGLPQGCTRVSVLVETVTATYQLEEILHALRERVTGLAAGRWDYVFSYLRTYGDRPDQDLPDRDEWTMSTPFLRTYTDIIVRTCHRRGVQAIGGPVVAAPAGPFAESVATTHARVHRDKAREAREGFDGAWTLHPSLVPVCREPFEERDARLGTGAEQRRAAGGTVEVAVDPAALTDVSSLPGGATLTGVRTAVRSSLTYLTGWLGGQGTLTMGGTIEDFGTVELARMQLWQWTSHGVRLAEGPTMSERLVDRILEEETELLRRRGAVDPLLQRAAELLRSSVVTDDPPTFLSTRAYELLLSLDEPDPQAGDRSPGAA